MRYYIWITVNVLVILAIMIYVWVFNPSPSSMVRSGQFFSQVAVLLFIVNINMHFIFKVIKKSERGSLRTILVKTARKMMRWHAPIAIVGTSLILIHAGIMFGQLGHVIGYAHPKMVSGYVALLILSVTLIGGYRRAQRATGFRRKFHLAFALLFGSFFLIHIFFPFT